MMVWESVREFVAAKKLQFMNDLRQALSEALRLVFSANSDFTTIVAASLRFSLSSTLLAAALGIPLGIGLANAHFRFKRLVEDVLNSLLAVPTVVIGLFVYTLIFSQGPLGRFNLLFSPAAIILGQTLLIFPLIASLSCSAVSGVDPIVRQTALTLGAGRLRTSWTVASEAKAALLVVCLTAFGRVIGEIGISLLLGGNILGYTRTITTAISLADKPGGVRIGAGAWDGFALCCFWNQYGHAAAADEIMSGEKPAYSIHSLIHAYDGKVVLDIPHLDIPSGRIHLLTGPNGSGKTTLLSILALLLTPVSGSVLLHGVETAGREDRHLRRKVTLIHQKPVLFSMTVRNNIGYGLRAAGLSLKEIDCRVERILEKARLRDIAEKPARKLSGGEAQRVVLARGLVLETPIVLLDEPTHSLDDESRPILFDLLREANRRGATVIIATHDPGILSSLNARVLKMEAGRIIG